MAANDPHRHDFSATWLLRNVKRSSTEGGSDGEEDSNKNQEPAPKKEKHDEPAKEKKEREEEAAAAAAEGAEGEPSGRPARDLMEPDNRLRVLAYSDSDSDVETHFKRVKDHLLPHHDAEAKAAEDTAAAEAAEAAEAEAKEAQRRASASGRALTQLAGSISATAGHVARQITPTLALKTAMLLMLRTVHPQAANVAEIAAATVGAAGLAGRRRSNSLAAASPSTAAGAGAAASGPSPALQRVQTHAIEAGAAAAIAAGLRLALEVHRRATSGRRRRINRLVSSVDLAALREQLSNGGAAAAVEGAHPPETAAEWAAVYAVEMREMKRMLQECGVELPAGGARWDDTDAELMRFAAACGLREADTAEARGAAIEKAVRRVIECLEWTAATAEVPEAKLRRWERLASWRGTDANGHPILLVRFGRALQLCTKSGRLDAFSAAIAAQVAAGVDGKLSNGPGGPERIVAVVDCRETSNWEALLRSRDLLVLIRRLSADLAAHYPGRLEKLHLLELPLLARVGLQSVLAQLAAGTRDRIVQCSAADDSLPVTMALLQRRRSYASGLGRSMSEISLGTSECSSPGGEHSSEGGGASRRFDDEENEGEETVAAAAEAAVAMAMVDREGSTSEYFSPRGGETTDPMEFGAGGGEGSGSGGRRANGDGGYSSNSSADAATQALYGGDDSGGGLLGLSIPAQEVRDERDEGVQTDSPATADVAANLLGALNDAAAGASSRSGCGGASLRHSSLAGSPFDAGPMSHHVGVSTPSSLSPQSSQGTSCLHEVLDTAAAAGGFGPIAGASAMLRSMLPSTSGAGATPRGRSPFPRVHRISPGTLSAEASTSSVAVTPGAAKMKGGLVDLPPRPFSARKTPAKSSLRRTQSQETPPNWKPLGSFPLRRQTSVSWAENLERVREIESTPSPAAGGLPPANTRAAGLTPGAPPQPQSGGGDNGADAERALPVLCLLFMVYGLLEKLLLG